MSKFCPSCGEELVDEAKFCKSCGMNLENQQETPHVKQVNDQEFKPPAVENDHKIAIIAGYVLAILIPILGIIVAIYLLTRKDSENAKKHGKYIIVVAAIIWFISIMLMR